MAITRAQQAKQMLRKGGRIGLKGGADAATESFGALDVAENGCFYFGGIIYHDMLHAFPPASTSDVIVCSTAENSSAQPPTQESAHPACRVKGV